jgi:succinate-acetate transporter protein
MALLMVIYTICATRTNAVFAMIFLALIVVFSLLAAAYWHLGQGHMVLGEKLTVVSPVSIATSQQIDAMCMY